MYLAAGACWAFGPAANLCHVVLCCCVLRVRGAGCLPCPVMEQMKCRRELLSVLPSVLRNSTQACPERIAALSHECRGVASVSAWEWFGVQCVQCTLPCSLTACFSNLSSVICMLYVLMRAGAAARAAHMVCRYYAYLPLSAGHMQHPKQAWTAEPAALLLACYLLACYQLVW